ncbi:MAG: hypothetical protein NT039_00475 [Candidatus Berkelbacteria bacterium]|nr:hypothetical protein [Candidatus Berkelbacteria bacterium]
MAATITHFVLADKVFDEFFGHLQKDEFFIGNIFSDIRYIGVIKREKTHSDNAGLKNIIKEDSFNAGMKFHQLTDRVEARFAKDNGVYSLFPHLEHATQSLKLFSDDILYPKVKNWQEYASFFTKILPGEQKFGIADKDILKWHQMVKKYISQKPNQKTRTELIKETIMPFEGAPIVNYNIDKIRKDGKMEKIIFDFYNNFEILLQQYENDSQI